MYFVSSLIQLEELLSSGSKQPILVGGELAYLSSDKSMIDALRDSDTQYVQQPPRVASRGRIIGHKPNYLYVALEKRAAEYIASYRGEVALAADQYLAYGLSLKSDSIVIGGGSTSTGEVNLEILVFSEGKLVETFEKNTHLSGYYVETVMSGIVAKYKDHEIHWCDPLDEPPLCTLTDSEKFVSAGDLPVRNLIKRKLFVKDQTVEESWGLVPAFAIAFVGFLVLVSVFSIRWLSVDSERAEYRAMITGYEQEYSNGTQSLNLLRHREHLLQSELGGVLRVANLEVILNRVASIDDVLIHSVKIFSPDDTEVAESVTSGPAGVPDIYRVEFSIPKGSNTSARGQVEPLIAMLSHTTGMTVRVITHAEDAVAVEGESVKYWRYTVAGGR